MLRHLSDFNSNSSPCAGHLIPGAQCSYSQDPPFRDETGKIIRLYGTSTDIQARKRAERAVPAKRAESQSDHQHDALPGMISSARW